MKNNSLHTWILAGSLIAIGTSCDPTPEPSSNEVEETDRTLFSQIDYAFSNTAKVWRGYEFSSFPQYYLARETENATPQRGFLVNPVNEVPGATRIPEENAQGLNVYRFDAEMKAANRKLKRGNGFYDYDYPINDGAYYVQVYNQGEVERRGTSSIELAVHEVFHAFQNTWAYPENSMQDEKNYPITRDLLPLQLMEVEIAKKMPGEADLAAIDKYLSMYVAIRSRSIELDPTADQLVKNMANNQELGEGTAKYVEYMVAKDLFATFDTSFEEVEVRAIDSKDGVRGYFAWGIWYGTGAAVTYMLKQKGVDVESKAKEGINLYQMAVEALSLTAAQRADYLAQAKAEFGWDTILKTEADRLLALK
ncbi:MAG: hypothetical protein AAFQ98_07340 [Bacteroidota bacterium]